MLSYVFRGIRRRAMGRNVTSSGVGVLAFLVRNSLLFLNRQHRVHRGFVYRQHGLGTIVPQGNLRVTRFRRNPCGHQWANCLLYLGICRLYNFHIHVRIVFNRSFRFYLRSNRQYFRLVNYVPNGLPL